MIDMIGAISGATIYAVIIAVLVGYSTAPSSQKLAYCAAAAVWGIFIVAVAALGGFVPGTIGPVPAVGLAFAVLLALLIGAFLLFHGFRNLVLSVPLPALIALNVPRIGGVFFLVLAADGRLSEPFAMSAGWGDIITGLFAILLAAMAWRGDRSTTPLALWNIFGAFDLIVAVSLGVLSAPGTPFRVFTEGPGTATMGTLPWIMIPAMLVPLYLLIHLAIATRLRSVRGLTRTVASAR
jgi:hypothetical protein